MPIISTDLPTHTSESEAAFTILAQCSEWVISGHWDGGHGCLLYSRVDIKEGNGKRQIVIDERAIEAQRTALETFRINNQEQPAYSSDNDDSDRLYDT